MRIIGSLILLMTVLLPIQARAGQSKPPTDFKVHSSENSGAEKVFQSAAPKVVFVITRSLGEVHARASGIILTPDGYIATNYHALEGADAVEIRFFPDPKDSDNYQSFNGAKLLYADAVRDIAVLKVNSKGMPFLECAAATACVARIGESVYALGNPMGLSNSISEGWSEPLKWHTKLGTVSGKGNTSGEKEILPEISANGCRPDGDLRRCR